MQSHLGSILFLLSEFTFLLSPIFVHMWQVNMPSWRSSKVGLDVQIIVATEGSKAAQPSLGILFTAWYSENHKAGRPEVTEPSYFQRTRSLFQLSLWLPFRSFKSKVANCGPQITTIYTMPIFIVLLEHSHTHSLTSVHGCFCATKGAEH